QTMVNSGWSYSTGWPSSTRMDSITPLVSASMWFIIFMASTMHRVSPFFTVWPTSTKDGELGEDLRQKVPTIGEGATVPFRTGAAGGEGAAAAATGAAAGAGAGACIGAGA